MTKHCCYYTSDASAHEGLENCKGPAYVFFTEFTNATGELTTMGQFMPADNIEKLGRWAFETMAQTARDQTGIVSIDAEDFIIAFGEAKDVEEME